jgi:autotransporter-associated beta strand protein
MVISSQPLLAASSSWTGASSPSWTDTGNWNPATVPNGTGDTATFPTVSADLILPTTITLNSLVVNFPSSVSERLFINSTGGSFIFGGLNPSINVTNDVFLLIFSDVRIDSNLTFNNSNLVSSGKNTFILNPISGAAGIINNTGSLFLNGQNTYSGGTTLAGGRVAIGTNTGLGSGAVTGSGGTLAFSYIGSPGGNFLNAVDFTAATTTTLDTAGTAGNTQQIILDGALTGSGNIIKAGEGALISNIANSSFTGGVTLAAYNPNTPSDGSTLGFGDAQAFGSGIITMNPNTTIDAASGLTGAITNPIVLNNPNSGVATYILSASSADLELSGPISETGAGTGKVQIESDGATTYVYLDGTNTYSGGTNVLSNFNLAISGTSPIGTGTLTLGDSSTLQTRANLTLTNDIDLASTSQSYVDLDGSTVTLNGLISGGVPGSALEFSVNPSLSTVTLSGPNTYVADTIVDEFVILSISSDANLGSTTGSIGTLKGNGGTLLITNTFADVSNRGLFFNNGFDTTIETQPGVRAQFNGPIGGTGNLTKFGMGILVLGGDGSQFSGNIHVTEGTLGIASLTATGQHSVTFDDGTKLAAYAEGVILQNGITLNNSFTNVTVDTGAFNEFTINSEISGTGNLRKIGAGILTLGRANSYSGATNINAGSLRLINSASLGAQNFPLNLAGGTTLIGAGVNNVITIANPTLLAGPTNTITAESGQLVFTGAVNQTGTSALTVNGAGLVSFQGTLNRVDSLVVTDTATLDLENNSVLTSTNGITIQAGATMSGTGSIGSFTTPTNVSNFGTIHPFVLNVTGNLNFEDASSFTPKIFGDNSTLLNIGGVAPANGNLLIGMNTTIDIGSEGAIPTVGNRYKLITYTGTYNQQHFANVSLPMFVGGYLDYSMDHEIDFVVTSSAPDLPASVGSGNAGSVARALNAILLSGSGAADGIYSSLIGIDPSLYASALDQMQPALFKGATVVQENNAFSVRNVISQRFLTVMDSAHCYGTCQVKDKTVHVWATGLGDFMRQSNTTFAASPQVGYHDSTGGGAVGVDYNFAKYFYVGALGAYTHSSVNWNQNQGHGDINTAYGGVYVSAIGNLVFANAAVIGAGSNFDENRKIVYPGVNETAQNKHHGEQLISHVDAGFNLAYRQVTIRPFDSFDWILQKEKGFTETGAGEYDLSVSKVNASMLRNELGLNFAACQCFDRGRATIDAKIGWVREVRIKGEETTSSFAGTDVPFDVIGYFPNRNLVSAGVAVSAVALKDLLDVSVYYNGVFGHKYMDNGFGAKLSFGF